MIIIDSKEWSTINAGHNAKLLIFFWNFEILSTVLFSAMLRENCDKPIVSGGGNLRTCENHRLTITVWNDAS